MGKRSSYRFKQALKPDRHWLFLFTTKSPTRQSRNRKSEYLAQRRKGRKGKPISELGVLGVPSTLLRTCLARVNPRFRDLPLIGKDKKSPVWGIPAGPQRSSENIFNYFTLAIGTLRIISGLISIISIVYRVNANPCAALKSRALMIPVFPETRG